MIISFFIQTIKCECELKLINSMHCTTLLYDVQAIRACFPTRIHDFSKKIGLINLSYSTILFPYKNILFQVWSNNQSQKNQNNLCLSSKVETRTSFTFHKKQNPILKASASLITN